ncbi:MAG: pectate lyase [Lewinella sp.]|nr:pectate lyase [Lewinella sp.]
MFKPTVILPLFALWLTFNLLSGCRAQVPTAYQTDPTAEKMLLYQRDNGGWAQYHGDRTDYSLPMTDSLEAVLVNDKDRLDTTIDDGSTTNEINYLLKAYGQTANPAYLASAEKGIAYLLEAQNPAGGWPQFYPDSTHYRIHITYNDEAMISVMWIIKRLAEDAPGYQDIAPSLRARAQPALERGIDCILRTQIRQNGQLTAWGAQHDSQTLAPAPARAFEPASLSSKESVGIVEFLISLESPSEEVKTAIRAAVAWLESVKIEDYNVKMIVDPSQPTGRDRVIMPDTHSSIWSRFYELGTNRPIFAGRDRVIKYDLREVENERRVGYGFYGKWPNELLKETYPAWEERMAH